MLLREISTIAGDAAKRVDHRYTSPEIGCTGDGRSPGSRVNDGRRSSRLPSDHSWRRLTAYSCGGSHGIGLSACTVFPFDPRREPSPLKLDSRPEAGKTRFRRLGTNRRRTAPSAFAG